MRERVLTPQADKMRRDLVVSQGSARRAKKLTTTIIETSPTPAKAEKFFNLRQQVQRPFNSQMARVAYRPKTQGRASPELGLHATLSPIQKGITQPKKKIGINDMRELER